MTKNVLCIRRKKVITKIVKFKATDGIILDGILQKCEKNTDKILIEVHGMTSNCFKEREKIIANKVKELDVDTLCFNNRGSEIIIWCQSQLCIIFFSDRS